MENKELNDVFYEFAKYVRHHHDTGLGGVGINQTEAIAKVRELVTAEVERAKHDPNRQGHYIFVGDVDYLQNIDDLYWSYVMEAVARDSAEYDHYKLEYVKRNMQYASFDKVGIHKMLARADQYARECIARFQPQPQKGEDDVKPN